MIRSMLYAAALLAATAFFASPVQAQDELRCDLVGESMSIKTTRVRRETVILNTKLTVENRSSLGSKSCFIEFFLSTDNFLDPSDTLIAQSFLVPLRPFQEKTRTLKQKTFKGLDVAGKRVIAVIDTRAQNSETDETNNVFVSTPIP